MTGLWTKQACRSTFLLWGWTMLLVVLLHATPTGGQGGTRTVGSAFDPATTSVALSPKRSKMVIAAKETRWAPSPELAADAPVPTGAVFTPLPSFEFIAPAPAQPYAVAALPKRLLTRPVGTRAPPGRRTSHAV